LAALAEWAEPILILGAGLLCGFGFALYRPIRATALAALAGGAVGAAGLWSMWQWHTWFAWMVPAMVQVPLALGCSVLAHTRRLHREKELLEQKIAVLEPALEMAAANSVSERTTKVMRATPSAEGVAASPIG